LREALLKEGLTLLEETGETSFSLRELARRVGVTANAAYRHFANKEALLMALAEEGFRQFGNNQMQIWQATPGSTAARFLASGCGYVRFAREHPALFRLMFGRMAAEHRSGGLEKTSRQTFTQLLDGVARVVGLTPDAPEARLVAYNAWALVHGYSHLILDGQLDGEMKDLEQMVESALKRWMPGKLYF
jgi:AcrR family transcriptional regulator